MKRNSEFRSRNSEEKECCVATSLISPDFTSGVCAGGKGWFWCKKGL